jgi:HEAT repeat protein
MTRICWIGVGLLVAQTAFAQAPVQPVPRPRPIRPIRPQPVVGQVPAPMPLDECLTKIKAPETRLAAIIALADHGPKGAPAIPDLLEALRGTDEDQRLNAALTLSKIGKAAVAPVAKLLDDGKAETRFYAIWTLGWIGPDAAETEPALVRAMADKSEDIRRKTAYALGRVAGNAQGALPVLVTALSDANADVRNSAADALGHFGQAAVPALVTALASPEPACSAAAHALGAIGHDAKEAKEAIGPLQKQLLAGGDSTAAMADALGKIGKDAIPALLAGVDSGTQPTVNVSIQALGHIGAEAAPNLVDLMGHKSAEVRRLATQTLVPLRISDKMVVLAYAYALKDSDTQVRISSIQGLQMLGPLGKLAAPKAEELLTDSDPSIRQQAFSLLRVFGVDPAPGMRKALEGKDDRIRVSIASLMLTTGTDRTDSVPILRDYLKNADPEIRIQAATTLAQMRLEGDSLVPILIEGLKNKTGGVRYASLQGLQHLGPQKAAGAVAAIVDLLDDADPNTATQVCYILRNLKADPKMAVPKLAKLLKSDNYGTKHAAIYALAGLGTEGSEALVAAYRAGKDDNERNAILQQLVNIGKTDVAGPLLDEALADKSPQVRANAVRMSVNLGRRNGGAWPIVSKALGDSDASVRMAAAQFLYVVNNDQNNTAKALEIVGPMTQNDKDINVRRMLVQNIGNFVRQPKQAVPILVACLKDGDAQIRWTAVQSLANFGADSAAAIPALEALREDADPTVRQVVANVLTRLEQFKNK